MPHAAIISDCFLDPFDPFMNTMIFFDSWNFAELALL